VSRKKREKAIVAEARRMAAKTKGWNILSSDLFNPLDGLVVRYYPDLKERKEFQKTNTYLELWKIVNEKMTQTGVRDGILQDGC